MVYRSMFDKAEKPIGSWFTIRFAPMSLATSGRQVTTTVGIPSRSSSLASAAPLRVPVPHVAGKTTPSTPADLSSLAHAWPMSCMFSNPPPFPQVLRKSS